MVHVDHGMTGGSYYKCVNPQRNEECGQLGAVGGCRLKNRAHRAQYNDSNIKKSTQVSIYLGSKQLGCF